jgi:hypothetical protein
MTPEERALLQTWTNCDENLLVRVQPLQIFSPWEQVSLSQRAGIMSGVLGDYARAIELLQQTVVLLNELLRDNPDEPDYALAAVVTFGHLAWCHAQMDMSQEALQDCAQGLGLLESNAASVNAAGEYRILESVSKIKQVAAQLDDHGLQYRIGRIELNAWQSLLDRTPDDPEVRASLDQVLRYMAGPLSKEDNSLE